MDLTPTPEQATLRATCRAWLQQALPADWGGLYRGPDNEAEYAAFQRDWEQRLYLAGFAGIAWPRAYGGQGLTIAEHLIVAEELGRVAAPEGINFTGTELVGPLLLAVGTEEQKQRFIPKILADEEIWCQGFSEPNAGSDLASLKTTAWLDAGQWVINGQKLWTSNASFAQWCLLLARTDTSVAKHKGLTMLLVPMDSPGITVRPLVQITGREDFNEVFFDGVRVPEDAHIGPVNDGWRTSNNVLAVERGTNRIYRQARFHHELMNIVQLASTPRADGSRALDDPHYAQRLAGAYINSAIHRYHNLRLVSRLTAGESVTSEISLIKAFWGVAHQSMATLGYDLLGAGGACEGPETTEAGRFQDLYLQSRSDTIYAGTLQIQRDIIANRVLGLPR